MMLKRVLTLHLLVFSGHLTSAQTKTVDNINLKWEDSGEHGGNLNHCKISDTDEGTFQKISPSSKYSIFIPESHSDFTDADATTICNGVDSLEKGVIQHIYDLKSLEQHILSPVWIGQTGNGISPMSVQRNDEVGESNEESKEEVKPCFVLKPMDGFLVTENVDCNSAAAGILCQFKKGSHCYLRSAEENANANDQELRPLGGESDSLNHYFVSGQKRSWLKARQVCIRNGLQLVKLDDTRRNQDLTGQLKDYLTEQHLHISTRFWSAGLFSKTNTSSKSQLIWAVGEDLDPASAFTQLSGHIPRTASEEIGEVDQSTGNEYCLDIFLDNEGLVLEQTNPPYWGASSCLLAQFFLCEKNIPAIPIKNVTDIVQTDPTSSEEKGGDDNGGTTTKHCKPTQIDPLSFDLDLTKPSTQEDLVKFMLFNVEHDLRSGMAPFEMKEGVEWKQSVINLLVKIAMKVVSTDYVDHGLLNVAKIINLMYQNAVANQNDTVKEAIWKELYIPHLMKCVDTVQKLPLVGTGFEIMALNSTTKGEEKPIIVYRELADSVSYLSSSLDILWYLFSLSVAVCYTLPEDKITFASDVHVAFEIDFLDKMKAKWTVDSGNKADLDLAIAMGDVDFSTSMRNLRHVVTAAYMNINIQDIELVRPLDMTQIYPDLLVPHGNERTNETLYGDAE